MLENLSRRRLSGGHGQEPVYITVQEKTIPKADHIRTRLKRSYYTRRGRQLQCDQPWYGFVVNRFRTGLYALRRLLSGEVLRLYSLCATSSFMIHDYRSRNTK